MEKISDIFTILDLNQKAENEKNKITFTTNRICSIMTEICYESRNYSGSWKQQIQCLTF